MSCVGLEFGHPCTNEPPRSTTQRDGQCVEHFAPLNNLSKFLKLKQEVVNNAQAHIRGCAMVICRTLAPDHKAVECLSAFGRQAQKYAAETLTTVEWGTQPWKLQEPFPVPLVPKWLCTLEFMQTMTPLRGELPLMPTGSHFKDIRVRCPAIWSWMAVLLQYWQDHMTPHLYGGQFREISDLTTTLIQDINLWLPHKSRFGWDYVALNATLWIDRREQFGQEHLEEWEAQRAQTCTLNDLEHNTEVIYRARIMKRQEDKAIADSKEAAAKELPPERQAAHAERQVSVMPRREDVSLTSTGATLYPNWSVKQKSKPMGPDMARPYWTPREGADGGLTLDKELDADLVFDPLQLCQRIKRMNS